MKCPRPMVVQTLIFTKKLYEPHDVYAWLAEKGFKDGRVEETGVSYRARQHDPNLFVKGSLRTISMGRGQSDVRAVVGCPIMSLWTQIQGARQARKLEKSAAKSQGLPPPAPLRPSSPKLSPRWTRVASAARRTERRLRAAERGLPPPPSVRTLPEKSLAALLVRSPPATGMSLRQYAQKHGLTLSSGARKLWKGRLR